MKALDAAVTPTGALRDGAVNVRTEEAITGETPLHKLARWDVSAFGARCVLVTVGNC